jgi:hypothetical protein
MVTMPMRGILTRPNLSRHLEPCVIEAAFSYQAYEPRDHVPFLFRKNTLKLCGVRDILGIFRLRAATVRAALRST